MCYDLKRRFDHQVSLNKIKIRPNESKYDRKVGEILAINPTTLDAKIDQLGLGAICKITSGSASGTLIEAISLKGANVRFSMLGDATNICVGDRIEFVSNCLEFEFSERLLGSILDGLGRRIDGPNLTSSRWVAAKGKSALSALDRPLINTSMETGIQAIDGFLTLGLGQRVALFGPAGCGKSSLMADIISGCSADVIVLALVGERGREVREFIERHLRPELRKRMIIVVSTSDRPALERAYAVQIASAVAEEYRNTGLNVLLLVDSLTRFARALREIGLASGEPAVRRGYPASVYPALPKIIERAGRSEAGSITAIYGVLVEGESETDPIADEIRSLTDGHIELSRDLASEGRFPAIDVVKSLSRVMPDIVTRDHNAIASSGRQILAKYDEIQFLLQVGEYQKGQDSEADLAVAKIANLRHFLYSKDTRQPRNLERTIRTLRRAIG